MEVGLAVGKRGAGGVVGQLAVRVTPYTAGFTEKLRRDMKAIAKSIPDLVIPVDVDTSRLLKQTQQAVREVEAAVGSINVGFDVDKTATDRLQETLDKIDKGVRDIKVGVQVDKKSLAKTEASLRKRLDSIINNVGKRLGKKLNETNPALEAKFKLAQNDLRGLVEKAQAWFEAHPAYYEVHPAVDEDSLSNAMGEIERAWRAERFNHGEPIKLPVATDEQSRIELYRKLQQIKEDWAQTQLNFKAMLDGDAEQRLEKHVKDLGKRLSKALNAEKVRVDVDLDADEDLVSDFAKHLRDRLSEHKTVYKIHPAVDSSGIDQAMREIENEWRRARFNGGKPLELPVAVDEKSRIELYRKLQQIKEDWDQTELDFKTMLDPSAHAVTWARLKVLTRDRWVKIKPVLDSKAARAVEETLAAISGLRMAKQMWTSFWDTFKNIDKNLPKIYLFTNALSLLGSTAVQVAHSTLGFARGIVQAVNALGLLTPSFIGGIATGGLVLIASLKDISKYARFVKDDWSAMVKSMRDSFWKTALPGFEAAWKEMFQIFRGGIDEVARESGSWFSSISTAFSKHFKDALGPILRNTAGFFKELSKGSDALMHSLQILSLNGSKYFQRFGRYITECAKSWEKWLVEARNTGKLDEIFETGIQNLRWFGQGMKNLGKAAQSLGRILEGELGPSMENFERITGSIADSFASARFKNAFSTFVRNMRTAFKNVTDISGDAVKDLAETFATGFSRAAVAGSRSIGTLVRDIANALAKSRKFWSGFESMFTSFSRAATNLTPVWGRLADGLGVFFQQIGRMSEPMSRVAAAMGTQLAGAAERLLPLLADLAVKVAPALVDIINGLAPLVVGVAEALLGFVNAFVSVPGVVKVAAIALVAFVTAVKGVQAVKVAATAISGLMETFTALRAAVSAANTVQAGGVFARLSAGAGAFAASAGGASKSASGMAVATSAAGVAGGKAVGTLAKFAKGAGWVGVAVTAASLAMELFGTKSDEASQAIQDSTVGLQRYQENLEFLAKAEPSQSFVMSWDSLAAAVNNSSDGFTNFVDSLGFSSILTESSQKVLELQQSLDNLFQSDPAAGFQALQQTANQMFQDVSRNHEEYADTINTFLDRTPQATAAIDSLLAATGREINEQNRAWAALNTTTLQREAATVAADKQRGAEVLVAGALENVNSKFGYHKSILADVTDQIGKSAAGFVDFQKAAADGGGESIGKFTGNLQKMTQRATTWADDLSRLVSRGASQATIDAFIQAGEDAAPALHELVNSQKGEFDKYNQEIEKAALTAQGKLSQGMSGNYDVLKQNMDQQLGLVKQAIISQLGEGANTAQLQNATNMQELITAVNNTGPEVQGAFAKLVKIGQSALDGADYAKIMQVKGEDAVNALAQELANKHHVPVEEAKKLIEAVKTGSPNLDLKEQGEAGPNSMQQGITEKKESTKLTTQKLMDESKQSAADKADWWEIGSNICSSIGNGISSFGSWVGDTAKSVITGAKNMASTAGSWLEQGRGMVSSLVRGIGEKASTAWNAAKNMASGAYNSVKEKASTFISNGRSAVSSFVTGIGEKASMAVRKGRELATSAKDAVANKISAFTGPGREAVGNFASAITSNAYRAMTVATNLAISASNSVVNNLRSFGTAGYNAAVGFANGIANNFRFAINAARNLGSWAANALQSFLRSHSPSRLFMDIGGYAGQGFAIGITNETVNAYRAAVSLGESVTAGVESGLDLEGVAADSGQAYMRELGRAVSDFGGATSKIDAPELGGSQVGAGSGVTVNQYIECAQVPKDSELASDGANMARMIGAVV